MIKNMVIQRVQNDCGAEPALAQARLPNFESGPVDESRGVAFNLFNNMWMCNYVLWYPWPSAVAEVWPWAVTSFARPPCLFLYGESPVSVKTRGRLKMTLSPMATEVTLPVYRFAMHFEGGAGADAA